MQPAPTPDTEKPTGRVNKPSPPREAWSVAEFCARWGFKRNTFYDLIASGELQTAKIGRRRIVTLAQEDAFRRRLESAAA